MTITVNARLHENVSARVAALRDGILSLLVSQQMSTTQTASNRESICSTGCHQKLREILFFQLFGIPGTRISYGFRAIGVFAFCIT